MCVVEFGDGIAMIGEWRLNGGDIRLVAPSYRAAKGTYIDTRSWQLGAATKECGDHIADPDRVAKRPPRSAGFLTGNEYRYPFGGRPIASMIFFMLTGFSHRATLLNRLGMADAS